MEQAQLEATRLDMPHYDVQQVVELIIDNVNQLKDTQGLKAPAQLDSATTLFGGDGFLDSMALVTLVEVPGWRRQYTTPVGKSAAGT